MIREKLMAREEARRLHWLTSVGRELRTVRIALGRSEPHLTARIDAALTEADRLQRRLKLRGERPSSGHQGETPC